MRLLSMVLVVVAVLSCGDGDRSLSAERAGKANTDCSLSDILAGDCADTEDPTLDEVPAGYEAPADSTAAAGVDSTDAGTAAADSTDAAAADTTETEGAVVDTVEADPVSVSVSVSVSDTFDIEVVFLPPSFGSRDFTDHEKQLVLKAARRWEEKFTRGIPDVYVDDYHAGRSLEYRSGTPPVTLPAVVDDIIVYVTSWRGPYWGVAANIGGFLPELDVINTQPAGLVRINVEAMSDHFLSDDWPSVVDEFSPVYREWTDVLIEDVAAHEIGHVLQGPEWDDFTRDIDGPFPYFAGSNAVAQFRFLLREGGLEYSGVMVPTEFSGGSWEHWFGYPINTDKGSYKSFAFWEDWEGIGIGTARHGIGTARHGAAKS